MTTFLYIFPHPDDESFGPAAAIAKQHAAGHDIHLLTLTRGGATRQRHRLGLTVEEMGEVRLREMQDMAKVLGLAGLTVEDLPDGGLKEMDPREIERVVREHIRQLGPDVIVSYPAHGVSGFDDHLVTHAVVKRVFCELHDRNLSTPPRRLAFTTFRDLPSGDRPLRLQTSRAEEIDCSIAVGRKELEAQRDALACYATYQEMIERMNPVRLTGDCLDFELFQEDFDPPLECLTDRLP